MRKFIFRGICFVAIGLALLTLVNHFYIRTNGYRSLDDMFKFYLMPEGIEVANLGSSHAAYGLYYEDIEEITGFNFALPGQSLYYDLKMLERFGDRLAEGCTVVIPLSYFSFDQQAGYHVENRWYYKLLGYNTVTGHRITDYVRLGLWPFLSASFNAKFLVKDKDRIEFDIYWIYAFFGIELKEDEPKGWRQSARDALAYYHRITGQGENVGFNMACLDGIIAYCESNGLKPVLITTPVTKYYYNVFPEEIREEFYARVKEVRERYGIPYIDYSRDKRLTNNLSMFGDSNHLNDNGRRVFTKVLLSDLGLIQGTQEGGNGTDHDLTGGR